MHLLSSEQLFQQNEKKIELIRNSSSGDFQKDWLPVMRSVSFWFNSAPLSPHLYDEPGGAFRCCVESAFFSLRLAKDAIFTSELTSEKRRVLEPQYHFATFLAAMFSWIDEPFRYYIFSLKNIEFNPIAHNSITAFSKASMMLDIRLKEDPLSESRQRTILMASTMLLPYLEKLSPLVQDSLYASINPDRRPQGSESVLQRVVRKGLAQAEELERRNKVLQITVVDRPVTSANLMEQAADDLLPAKNVVEEHEKEKVVEQPVVVKQAVSKSSEPLEQLNIPGIPNQFQELFSALADDIKNGRKKAAEAEWIQSGLLIPANFFSGYGKAVTQYVETLKQMKIIVGTQGRNVLIIPSVGELLLPRNN